MAGGIKDLAAYRFERANEELTNAKDLLAEGKYKLSMNRSYYAVFHAMRSVNTLDAFDSSKHSGVIAHFNQYHVKNGDFPLSQVVVNDSVTREAITPDQMRKFLKFVHDDNCCCKYYEAIYILFHTGMRIWQYPSRAFYNRFR